MCRINEITQFIFHSSHRPQWWKYSKTNSPVLFHLLMCMLPTNILHFWLTDESGRTSRRNYRLLSLSLSFWRHFQHKELANMNEYERVPWVFAFLRTPLPSFCIWSKFWFKQKAWPLRAVSAPCLFSCRRNTLTLYWLWGLLNSHVSQIPWDAVFTRHQWGYTRMGWQGTALGIALLLTYVLHCPISHHLQNTSSEVKLVIKTSRWQQAKD